VLVSSTLFLELAGPGQIGVQAKGEKIFAKIRRAWKAALGENKMSLLFQRQRTTLPYGSPRAAKGTWFAP